MVRSSLVGVAGYGHFLSLAERAQWDERAVDLRSFRATPELVRAIAGFCVAEAAVASELEPIIADAPPEAVACLRAQQRDEERHARYFARLAREGCGSEPEALREHADPEWTERFLVQLPAVARSGNVREAVGLYHMTLEAHVLKGALVELVDAGVPGAAYVLRDERWHIGFGLRLLSDLGVPEREILASLR
jgi:ribonucleoside-diphosphate reductase beta chain